MLPASPPVNPDLKSEQGFLCVSFKKRKEIAKIIKSLAAFTFSKIYDSRSNQGLSSTCRAVKAAVLSQLAMSRYSVLEGREAEGDGSLPGGRIHWERGKGRPLALGALGLTLGLSTCGHDCFLLNILMKG